MNIDKLLKSDDVVSELRKISQEATNDLYNKLCSDIISLCYQAAIGAHKTVTISYSTLGHPPLDLVESVLYSNLGPIGFKIISLFPDCFTVSWEKELPLGGEKRG